MRLAWSGEESGSCKGKGQLLEMAIALDVCLLHQQAKGLLGMSDVLWFDCVHFMSPLTDNFSI
jgi:hypothetical protein